MKKLCNNWYLTPKILCNQLKIQLEQPKLLQLKFVQIVALDFVGSKNLCGLTFKKEKKYLFLLFLILMHFLLYIFIYQEAYVNMILKIYRYRNTIYKRYTHTHYISFLLSFIKKKIKYVTF